MKLLFKKGGSANKEIYQAVSIPPHLSKVFERIIYQQIDTFMEIKSFALPRAFRKDHNVKNNPKLEKNN